MAGDGRIDGKFTIQSGGISQAIRDELGLTQEECGKLGKSVWTQIFQQVEAQNKQTKIYSGGSDAWGKASENFVVAKGQVVEFSAEIWGKIVKLVNDKLDKDIAVAAANSAEVNEEQAAKDSAEIKVTVPKSEVEARYDKVSNQAPAIAKQLKSELQSNWVDQSKVKDILENLKKNPDLLALVVLEYGDTLATDIDEVFGMGFGFDKKDFYNYVLAPLINKAKNGCSAKIEMSPAVTEDSSIEDMQKRATDLAKAIKNDIVNNQVSPKKAEREELQEFFDDANNFLVELANSDPKPEIVEGKRENKNTREAHLPDGRFIIVMYDDSGEISDIAISNIFEEETLTTSNGKSQDCAEIRYSKDKAQFNNDNNEVLYDGYIDKGYNFEKLKALAERIFGKWETPEE